MKYSKQREALLKLLRSTRSHPTANRLYRELQKEFPNISLGTVYRNLAQLSQNGDIMPLNINTEKEHFDGFTHEHYHFVCNRCGAVIDVDLPDISDLNSEIEKQIGAQVEKCSMSFYGICKSCIDQKKQDL